MRVFYAVQILSKSMTKALRYYQAYDKRLQGCKATAEFCEKFNNLFDVLNKLKPLEALSLSSTDLKIIEDFLQWLNDWEKRVQDGILTNNNFLIDNTAECLRVTLHSTIDLTHYLITEHDCQYVLTGKINQDPLETEPMELHMYDESTIHDDFLT